MAQSLEHPSTPSFACRHLLFLLSCPSAHCAPRLLMRLEEDAFCEWRLTGEQTLTSLVLSDCYLTAGAPLYTEPSMGSTPHRPHPFSGKSPQRSRKGKKQLLSPPPALGFSPRRSDSRLEGLSSIAREHKPNGYLPLLVHLGNKLLGLVLQDPQPLPYVHWFWNQTTWV